MKKSGVISLLGILIITATLLGLTIGFGNSPLLGLDLQGGVEVILRPTAGQDVTSEKLELAADRIRRRVDSLGVAEPDVTRQGENIIVQLPGVDNQEQAVGLVGQTGKLEFRPALSATEARLHCGERIIDTSGLIIPGGSPAEVQQNHQSSTVPIETINANIERLIAEYDTARAAGQGVKIVPECENMEAPTQEPQTNNEEIPPDIAPFFDYDVNRTLLLTDSSQAAGEDTVIYLEDVTLRKILLGPALLDGSALTGAEAILTGINAWSIQLRLKGGAEGIDLFNEAALICASGQAACPTRALGVVLDGVVESLPEVQQAGFERDQVFIQGNFSQSEARDLALILRFGALPLEFDDPVEAGLIRSVSATLGKDSLRAGIIAGIIGISLVAIFMIAYYRIVGALALASLTVSALLLWIIVTFLSTTQGLTLTLAGITGLIVSIGVSLDSNVVYFENLKEDLNNGKTLRSAATQSFPIAFKTIFWANLATLIGAGILWWLTIGSVKGFAAILILASALDLVATYFFLRPAVRLLAHSRLITRKPKWLIGVKDDSPTPGTT